jgi:thiol reductant ABC exporter CydD subunit
MGVQRRLLLAARHARVPLAGAVAVGVLGAALAVAQAALLARTISGAFLGEEGLDALAEPLALLAVVLVARASLGWGSEVLAQRISGAVKSELRVALLGRAVALGPRRGLDRRSGEVALLATRGLDALDGYFGRYLPQAFLAAIVPVAVVACLLAVDLVAALTVALTVPLIPVFMVLIGRMSASHRSRRWRSLALLAHRFSDVVGGLPTLRAYGQADAQVGILRAITDRYRTATLATLRVAFLSALALELLATLSVALVAVGVGLRLVEGSLTLEVGLFALVLAPEAYLPLRRLGAEFHASEEGVTAARAAFEIIDARDPAADGGAEPPARITGLAVSGVSVAHPGRDVLAPAEASLVARPGELVAVTGPSGAGKSTLLAAILGFVEPSQGRIVVTGEDGTVTDLRDLDGDAWRSRVAWVPQVPFLFAGTIADNVRLGADGASDEEVGRALAAAGLADLDPGRSVGERGSGLSSGQRRRVGVARALVRGAPVLLLDEPTAGLDEAAEADVMGAIRSAADAGAIVLLVAHRPGAVARADRVVELRWREVAPVPGVPVAAGVMPEAVA